MNLSAAIPAYNAAPTLARVIADVRAQIPETADLLVVDDGSTDETAQCARDAGTRVVSLGANLGRGAARARALAETDTALVFMCDSTLDPAPDFLAHALPWFDDGQTAAVFGHVKHSSAATVAERWRNRHLFKAAPSATPNRHALLATSSCVLRVEAVKAVGGFDANLRAGEDADLGQRLLRAGWNVVADPALHGVCLRRENSREVLIRYARWNSPSGLQGRDWWRQLAYAIKVMAVEDLRAGDPLAALMSLACPFYQQRRR